MDSDTYLCNLQTELFRKMNQCGWSVVELAIQCDLSYKTIYNIVTHAVSDIKLSTFVKICNNLDIPLSSVLMISDAELASQKIRESYLVCGGKKYVLKISG